MKEIELTAKCYCGFSIQRVFYTNKYEYFEISVSYCPDCFNILGWDGLLELPKDTVEVKHDNKRRC